MRGNCETLLVAIQLVERPNIKERLCAGAVVLIDQRDLHNSVGPRTTAFALFLSLLFPCVSLRLEPIPLLPFTKVVLYWVTGDPPPLGCACAAVAGYMAH